MSAAVQHLGARLAGALARGGLLEPPRDGAPASREDAYAVQEALLAQLDETVAAWKVGTAPDPDPVWGSPLPRRCVMPSPARVRWPAGAVCGLEAEIAFRFARDFPADSLPDSDGEILESLESMALAVEIVSSRWRGWPEVPDLLKLADLQNHGLLVLGEPVPYRPDFPFLVPRAALRVDGTDVSKHPAGNPAGDPRRLLAPFVRQCAARGLPVAAGHWITTGSYSGIHFAQAPADVRATLEALPPLHLSIA